MNNKYNHILIDGSNLYHRSYALFNPIGKDVIQHLFDSIDKIQNDFCNDKSIIYFIFDNSQSQINIRKNIDPLYKSNREKTDKNIYKYHNIFIELLKVRSDNYKILMAGNLEADDLVKPLLNYIKNYETGNVLLISNDLDWSRNINDKTYWYNWSYVLNKEEFYSKYGFFPSEEGIKIYKSIKGDKSDNIPIAVHNFPNDIVIKICNDAYNFKSLKDFTYYIENTQNIEDKYKQLLKINMREIKRNYTLVDFIDVNVDIKTYIKNCKKIDIQLRLLMQGLGMSIPDNLKRKDEIEKDFFNI